MGTMMIYTIFDKIGESAGFLFEQQNDLTAIRSVRKQITEDKNDFILYRVGTIDHRTMAIKTCEPVKINWLDEEIK